MKKKAENIFHLDFTCSPKAYDEGKYLVFWQKSIFMFKRANERVRKYSRLVWLSSSSFFILPSVLVQKERGSEAFSRCVRSRWDFFSHISGIVENIYFFVSPKNRKHTEAEKRRALQGLRRRGKNERESKSYV